MVSVSSNAAWPDSSLAESNIDNRLIAAVYLSSLGASFFCLISLGIPFLASCVTISALAGVDKVKSSLANAVPRCGTRQFVMLPPLGLWV